MDAHRTDPEGPGLERGKVELWRYRASEKVSWHPPLLLFLGLVSRSYIFDLDEQASLVRRLGSAGFEVYVLDWGVPDAADSGRSLETYVLRYLPAAMRAVRRTSGSRDVTMIGYCMGGNLALLSAATDCANAIRNLIIMATPIDANELPPIISALRDDSADLAGLIDSTGCVPAQVIDAMFRIRKPTADLVQYVNLWENLWNDAYIGAHKAIARWTRDHVPIPGVAFRQVVESWLRGNAFVTGNLRLAGRRVGLDSIAVPTLAIVADRDEIVPPASAKKITDVLDTDDFELLTLDAGHVGLTVSRTAARVTVPHIIDWLERHSNTLED
jgi:polyhydroxyalkanoate synthase